ncbi:hypothetical protein PZ895_07820 [Mesorhizobium sp. YIM 152430]|uniref:hypothetical protein n=1 Tax=Mesorhizobium sp. YIM 152430 TaxID=3031761 RepID=UPI0023DA8549|nr:hypothetical protein [Mesorhizobium sp. YIM 152430]MDF1599682.1 hypothetical protein [Mesorhizobium sp. YIM 152430]
MSALRTTAEDLTTALVSATFGATPAVRWVEDEDTGERVGWVRVHGDGWEWRAGSEEGYGRSIDDCLARIESAVLRQRKYAEIDARRAAELAALPQPLRDLRMIRDTAKTQLAIEEARTVRRPDDLAVAQRAYDAAVMEYEVAERQMAEAA